MDGDISDGDFQQGYHVYDRSGRAGAGPVTEGTAVPPSLYTYHEVGHSGEVNRIGQGFRELERTKIAPITSN